MITRRHFNHPADSQHERTQVTSIMKGLINPHMHRIRRLFFDVMFSSSLPSFPGAFRGTASILDELHLRCKGDNGSSADEWASVMSTEQRFPALDDLLIDGRNYYNACKGGSHFAVEYTGVWFLAISRYKPPPGESFLVSDFLRPITTIKDLRYLEMTDLTLDPSPLPLPTATKRPILSGLHLKDIHNSKSLAEIFDFFTHTSEITVTHSAIGDVGPFNSKGCLTLEDIDADQDLVPLLRNWEGYYLTVKGCPSFNDTVLHMMAPREDGAHNCAHYMAKLVISDCPNFSVAALKQLVSAKLNAADVFAIESLQVSGRAPDISAGDRQWLTEKVDMFDMYT
jgi:hypothetical protein